MREINTFIIHCSDTYPDMDIGVEEIRRWHKERGWSDIGYHYVIRRNGKIEEGRNDGIVGAHAKGMNENSLGICMVGGKSKLDSFDLNTVNIKKASPKVINKI